MAQVHEFVSKTHKYTIIIAERTASLQFESDVVLGYFVSYSIHEKATDLLQMGTLMDNLGTPIFFDTPDEAINKAARIFKLPPR